MLYPWDSTANSGAGGYGVGVAWNGLTGVSQSPEGGEPTALWADNIKYLNLMSSEEFNATITYDYKTKSITEHYVWKRAKRVLTIIIMFILTLFFEWLALKMLSLPENKRNLLSILIVNVLTNIPFNIFMV